MGDKVSLEDALQNVHVHDPDEPFAELNEGNCPKGWWAVSTDDQSILAYFAFENDAYKYRFAVINDMLNGTYKY